MKLVEELRQTAEFYRPHGDRFPGVHELLSKAADEIERLREEVASLNSALNSR